MPIQKQDRDTQWILDQADSRWELARKATITVENQHGIYEGTTGSDIQVLGDIKVSGEGFAGVRFMGSNSSVTIGEDAVIKARDDADGIFAEGAGQSIVNRGVINSFEYGIRGAIWGEVTNFGIIRATYGIYYDGAGSVIENHGRIDALYGVDLRGTGRNEVINAKDGVIEAGRIAVHGNYDCELVVKNAGLIKGGEDAIFNARIGATLTLENTGRIVGDIWLGEAFNHIDTSRGEIRGTIHGGAVDDVYIIGQSKLKIVETSNGGFDRLDSYASYRLADNIETLRLRGSKDIDGTGNAGDNDLVGNSGDNRIDGKAGADILMGGRGDDIMTGGAGIDVFLFEAHCGRDVITDFTDGVDQFLLPFDVDRDEFDDLDIRQVGDDAVIFLDKGDHIVFRDIDRRDLDYNDLAIP